jgi:hypothetical protein
MPVVLSLVALKAEITAVRAVIDKDWPEGTTSEQVARVAIKALDDLRMTSWRPVRPPLQIGQIFRHVVSKDTYYVAWIGLDGSREMAWIVSNDSDYGWFTPHSSPFWKWSTMVDPPKGVTRKIKVKVKNEFGSIVLDDNGDEMTRIEERYYPPVHESIFINEIGMVVGDRIMLRMANRFEVIATHKGGVLLKERDSGQIYPERNADIKEYYEDGWD